jgi:hypothetical protein
MGVSSVVLDRMHIFQQFDPGLLKKTGKRFWQSWVIVVWGHLELIAFAMVLFPILRHCQLGAVSTCIPARWTIGRVKDDIYMRYATSGDQVVGCLLSLSSIIQTNSTVTPVHFLSASYEGKEPNCKIQFPVVSVFGIEQFTHMCFVSITFH